MAIEMDISKYCDNKKNRYHVNSWPEIYFSSEKYDLIHSKKKTQKTIDCKYFNYLFAGHETISHFFKIEMLGKWDRNYR